MVAKRNNGRSQAKGDDEAAFASVSPRSEMPGGYAGVLAEIEQRISQTRASVVVAANRELVSLYWEIGNVIVERRREERWGSAVIDRLSHDLREAHPEMKGFSSRNLRYMANFAEAFADPAIVKQVVSTLPWGHVIRLLQRVKDPETRLWYARHASAQGWSRAALELQIDGRAHERQGQAITNFEQAMAPQDSERAQQAFKDPYLFDFLGTADLRRERDVEQALIDHIQRFLLELGSGFAFVGRQVPLKIGDQTFSLDLLFYHLHLRCFIVIELKAVAFSTSLPLMT